MKSQRNRHADYHKSQRPPVHKGKRQKRQNIRADNSGKLRRNDGQLEFRTRKKVLRHSANDVPDSCVPAHDNETLRDTNR